jgi:phosphopantothenoylcysteine decarboxylase/phosphopantothenate--cysteine ligase
LKQQPQQHPSKDIIGSKGNELSNKKIALLVTSSVAAFKAPEIARELMRHGAEVYAAVTHSTGKMIGSDLFEWATGNPVVRELTGKLEHIQLAGKSPDHVDLVLIAPCTANTIGKIASGIDDTPVTTIAATAIGSKIPIIIVPAMHEPLYDHPIVQDNISRLQKIGVEFIDPEITEGKAKIATTDRIVQRIITRLSNTSQRSETGANDLKGRRVMVTAGPTVEHIDPIRVITNKSSGKMGIAIAEEVVSRGANTTLILGPTNIVPVSSVNTIRIESTDEMLEAVLRELKDNKYDLVFAAGAPSDYRPSHSYNEKIKTRKNPTVKLELQSTPKIIQQIRHASPDTFLVAFKTDQNLSKDDLVNEAFELIHENTADLVAANDVGQEGRGFQSDTNELYVVDGRKTVVHIPLADKKQVARQLVNLAVAKLKK